MKIQRIKKEKIKFYQLLFNYNNESQIDFRKNIIQYFK